MTADCFCGGYQFRRQGVRLFRVGGTKWGYNAADIDIPIQIAQRLKPPPGLPW